MFSSLKMTSLYLSANGDVYNAFSFLLVENDDPKENNTIVFKLHVRCERGGQRITGKSAFLGIATNFKFCYNHLFYTQLLLHCN